MKTVSPDPLFASCLVHEGQAPSVSKEGGGCDDRIVAAEGSGVSRAPRVRHFFLSALWLCLAGFSGCASLTFPVSGIPAHRVPPELLGEPVEKTETIDLALLGQPAPDIYRLCPEDVLGIWIDGILGSRSQAPPIHTALLQNMAPGLGFPVPVREDGTVSLPLVPPIRVAGLSLAEAEQVVARAYTVERRLLKPGVDRIMVTLVRPRTVHVVVMRQESVGGATIIEDNILINQKRGTGYELDLPAYKNDVLNALAQTGGLPGLEALNRIIVYRHVRGPSSPLVGGQLASASLEHSRQTIEIPLRARPGEPLPFGPEDVVLHDGDVVFIEARDSEVFYTGGLLPTGQFTLPRDYDLDVVEAISRVGGTMVNGGFDTNAIFFTAIPPGLGGPSPSMAIVLRRTPDGGQVPIRVNLNRALRDPRERILIQPGDVVLLQQTPGEAVVRYASEMVNFFANWRIWTRRDSFGVASIALP